MHCKKHGWIIYKYLCNYKRMLNSTSTFEFVLTHERTIGCHGMIQLSIPWSCMNIGLPFSHKNHWGRGEKERGPKHMFITQYMRELKWLYKWVETWKAILKMSFCKKHACVIFIFWIQFWLSIYASLTLSFLFVETNKPYNIDDKCN